MHRSERNWRDPLAFLPERWLPGTAEAAEVGGGGWGRGEAAQHGMLLCCNVLPCNPTARRWTMMPTCHLGMAHANALASGAPIGRVLGSDGLERWPGCATACSFQLACPLNPVPRFAEMEALTALVALFQQVAWIGWAFRCLCPLAAACRAQSCCRRSACWMPPTCHPALRTASPSSPSACCRASCRSRWRRA